jgi:membrane dipeptidase
VGPKTSRDVIAASRKPVAYSHCLPKGLKDHPRNKTDDELRHIAESGGFIGVTMFPPFLRRGNDAAVADYIEAMDYVIDLAGEDAVGIGTDFTQGHGDEFMQWITHDKGYARQLTEFGAVKFPAGLGSIGDMANLTQGMADAGWPENRIRKILGENWLALLESAWDV